MADIIHKVTSLKHGTFVRVKYRTDVQPSAKFKGHKIEKIVETTVRVGVSYSNLSAVKERRASEPYAIKQKPVQWWKWSDGYKNVIKEKISDPSQRYVTFATVPSVAGTQRFAGILMESLYPKRRFGQSQFRHIGTKQILMFSMSS